MFSVLSSMAFFWQKPWLQRQALSILIMAFIISPSDSATCSSQTFTNNKQYTHCNDLPSLQSYLHWAYDQASSTLSVAFVATPAKSDGWISWAINPTAPGMVGSQALIAFKDSTGAMTVKTYNITGYAPLKESKVWFDVKESKAEASGGVMRLFATVVLPESGKTTVNHVWQVGSSVTRDVPDKHAFEAANLNAKGTLDLLNGQSNNEGGGSVDSRTRKKNIHGILNVVSWGILFPVGGITARFLKHYEFGDPAWFYLHIFFQLSAYIIGVAGWGTGLKLGGESKGIEYPTHRNIGIALFCLATVQIFALFLRPKKDHKYRFYWNIYHHGLGYTIITLGIVNIYQGLDILSPAKKWRTAYMVVLIVLAVVTVVLQMVNLLMRKSKKSRKPYDGYNNGGAAAGGS